MIPVQLAKRLDAFSPKGTLLVRLLHSWAVTSPKGSRFSDRSLNENRYR